VDSKCQGCGRRLLLRRYPLVSKAGETKSRERLNTRLCSACLCERDYFSRLAAVPGKEVAEIRSAWHAGESSRYLSKRFALAVPDVHVLLLGDRVHEELPNAVTREELEDREFKKTCASCGRRRDVADYSLSKTSPDGLSNRCNSCSKAALWSPAKIPTPAGRWKPRSQAWDRVLSFYGLTSSGLSELRSEMEAASEGRCYLCGHETPQRLRKLDHHHGYPPLLRGILCPTCNGIVGAIETSSPGRVGGGFGVRHLPIELKRRTDRYLTIPVDLTANPARPAPPPLEESDFSWGDRCDLVGACFHRLKQDSNMSGWIMPLAVKRPEVDLWNRLNQL
jgi:hypothetical protein